MIKFRISVFDCRLPTADFKSQIANRKSKIVRFFRAVLIGILFLNAPARPSVGAEDAQTQSVIIVVGAPGAAEYAAQFAQWADLWEKACAKGGAQYASIGLGDIETSGGILKAEGFGDGRRQINHPQAALEAATLALQTKTDRTALQELLAKESGQNAAALWLIFIGHGTFDGRSAKFNLRGPDVSADELGDWLRPFSRPLVVINTASSSAPFLNALSGPNRVIITATKSGFEQNYTRFGQYLAEAIADPRADLDKDGQTSLLEAFLSASAHVTEFYSAAGRLATEHSLLDDNGDGLGTRPDWFRGVRPVQKAADGASLDGYRAAQCHLVRSQAENNMPLELRTRRDALELEVIKLRDARESFSEDEYFSRLEKLLCDIAQIYEQTDKAM